LAFSPKEKFMAEAIKGFYSPRNPTTKDFYRLVEDHAENLEAIYPEKYERVFGFLRPVVKTTMDRYLECGIYENGFARVRCGDCRSEYLVPFSCKTRGGFCNSCSEKRSLIFAEHINTKILEEVNHKHYVFSIPKIIRPYFKFNRKLLGKLCHCCYDTVKTFYQEVVPDKDAVPGAVLIYQTFGAEAANYHCHVHGLFSEGAFDKSGQFYPVTGIPYKRMEEYFRLSVLGMLKNEGLISEDLIRNLLGWKHSGFNIHAEGKAVINDDQGRERLAKYMIRPPISMARLTYDRENQVVYYRTDKETLSFDPVEFLARLSVHVPNAREQTVRYMGYYSNKSRGMRKRAGLSEAEIEIMEQDEKESRSRNCAWARLIKKVYETSPLVCKKCGGEMKVIAIITDYETRKKILKHLGLWNQRIHSPPSLPNFHPPPGIDPPVNVDSYFQDFLPPDDHYIIDQPFFP
jgi:hypothetical protein